jgi:hypothetical protein
MYIAYQARRAGLGPDQLQVMLKEGLVPVVGGVNVPVTTWDYHHIRVIQEGELIGRSFKMTAINKVLIPAITRAEAEDLVEDSIAVPVPCIIWFHDLDSYMDDCIADNPIFEGTEECTMILDELEKAPEGESVLGVIAVTPGVMIGDLRDLITESFLSLPGDSTIRIPDAMRRRLEQALRSNQNIMVVQ